MGGVLDDLAGGQLVQCNAGHRVRKRAARQGVDLPGSILDRQARRPDVGDAVSMRVHCADAWSPCGIGAKRIGSRQAGTLANQHDGEPGVQQLADLIANGDAPLFDQDERTKGQPSCQQKDTQARLHNNTHMQTDTVYSLQTRAHTSMT